MLTPADEAYVRASFAPLEVVCGERLELVQAAIAAGGLPRATYVLADGSAWVPVDFLALVDEAGGVDHLRRRFEERYVVAADIHGSLAGPDELDRAWEEYLDGRWHAELTEATPEAAVVVQRLVAAIETLLDRPDPESWRWCNRLRARVEHLAALTRPATEDDRKARGEPLVRDLFATAPQERYPEAFSEAASGG